MAQPGGATASATRPGDPQPSHRPPALVWAALVIVYVVWGSTYLGIRISVETIPPYTGAALRFAVAGILLGAVIAARRGPAALRVTGRQLLSASVIGILLLAGGNGMVVVAEAHRVPSGVAALLIATVPLLVVVLRLVTGDRPRLATLAGVLVGFGGLAELVASAAGGGATVPVGWALLVVAAAGSWSLGSFLSRPLPLPPDPFVASVYEMIAGAVVLGLGGMVAGERLPVHVSTRSWLALGYLVVAGSVIAFTAYVWLLGNAPISLVSTYAYVNPAVAVALGALVVHEPITPAVLLSGLVIVVGVVLVVSTERRRKASPSSAPSTASSTASEVRSSRSSHS
ncbi:MAG TPA: EamA family transporter [Planosporangium sp.]|nr:EamA family transporter [Planosporangium sp.]